MNRKLVFCILFAAINMYAASQHHYGKSNTIIKLDSIKNSASPAKHFAGLYYNSAIGLDSFAAVSSPEVREFIERFEGAFARFFFDAAEADKNKSEIQAVWKEYFSDTTLSELQLKLMGANAHINGDIWQALRCEFTPGELKKNRAIYISVNKAFRQPYQHLFNEAITLDKRIARLHELVLGLERWYGWVMLKRWRKRQVRLAILYYENPRKFEKREKAIHKKKLWIDRLIIRMLGNKASG